MTGTLITLTSILLGIIAANIFGYFNNKYSFGLTGNTLIGVFGSVFFIKVFGRLGFDPWSIMNQESFHYGLFTINCFVSALGGVFGIYLLKKLVQKMNKKKS